MRKPVLIGLIAGGAVMAAIVLSFFVAGSNDSARTPAESAQVAADPVAARALSDEADQALQSGNIDAALYTYTLSIDKDPGNAETYVRRGRAHRLKHNAEGEIADYTRALEIGIADPALEGAVYGMRADVLARSGKIQEALPDFDRALSLNPKLSPAYIGRGLSHLILGNFDRARPDFERALAEQPDNERALYSLGIIAYAARDWKKAEPYFQKLYDREKSEAQSATWLILTRKRNGAKVDPAEFQEINRSQWPGQVVAHLLGQEGPLDKFIDETPQNHPQLNKYICVGSFATFSLVQIEGRLSRVTEDFKKINPAKPYLTNMQEIFDGCADGALEGRVGQMEVQFLKAQK